MTDLSILDRVDPCHLDYSEWLSVGMALHHEGADVAVWDEWSRRDTERYRHGECQRKWAGFHGSGTPVTLGSVVEFAKSQGWTPPARELGTAYEWDDSIAAPREDLTIIDPTWVEDREVSAPGDWNPAHELSTYLSALFQADEYVGYVTESWVNEDGKALPKKGSYSRTCGELLQEIAQYRGDLSKVIGDYDPAVGVWIRFNPLDGRGVRDENVTSFRYALVESDTLSIEKQAAIYAEMELPIAILVHSGGKSLHAIVRIGATSKEEYRERVQFLHKVCKQNGLEIDTQNKNPSRLSRMPGAMRNGNKQYIVGLAQGKANWDEWKTYVEEANDNLPDFEPLASVFDNLPELAPPLIDGVLRRGHKMLLSGPSKAGKSYMLLQLVIALAEGTRWLGWDCARGRVLYVNLELDRASCLHRLKSLYDTLSIEPLHVTNIDIWNLRGSSVPLDQLAPKLIRRAKRFNYSAVIIDPIYKVITGDENAADKMAFFCNQFDRLCHELKAAVIYCHHHSKGNQGQKTSRDRSSGSGVFARDPDAILDAIELIIHPKMRKQIVNRAVCNALAAVMDDRCPQWRDDFSQDDALIADKIAEHARMMMPGYLVEADIIAATKAAQAQSGWRLEGTLREFAPFDPRHFWFKHPIHVPDADGMLLDAKADGEESPWITERREKAAVVKEARESGVTKILREYNLKAFDPADGPPLIGDIADALNVDLKQAKTWLRETKELVMDSDGYVWTRQAHQQQQIAAGIEACTDITGVCSLDALAKHMNRTPRRLRQVIESHPDAFDIVQGAVFVRS